MQSSSLRSFARFGACGARAARVHCRAELGQRLASRAPRGDKPERRRHTSKTWIQQHRTFTQSMQRGVRVALSPSNALLGPEVTRTRTALGRTAFATPRGTHTYAALVLLRCVARRGPRAVSRRCLRPGSVRQQLWMAATVTVPPAA